MNEYSPVIALGPGKQWPGVGQRKGIVLDLEMFGGLASVGHLNEALWHSTSN